jgi:hypothetical protein
MIEIGTGHRLVDPEPLAAMLWESVGQTKRQKDGEMDQKATVNRLQRIQERLTPLKAALLTHSIYQEIDRPDSLRLFMEHHVFAVWDFMSLLKALQRRLCCVEVPWLPAADPLGSRLVNEIVLAEESDDDGQGGFASHFELYRRAMKRCGANSPPAGGPCHGQRSRCQPVRELTLARFRFSKLTMGDASAAKGGVSRRQLRLAADCRTLSR